eukprot:CAMPEP_0172443734 /NCGR_PEP_ID=MMETSP1065-20121228/3947_1 /TAXON_ID=265537 /ORGANISM="Amphiprora paludosa, Strain CCMP125" /LENGTH=587 /DNA_ID=CAMNT_0013194061 /DNA_START=89 /DNA_END=1852 /DNA_ORIENTATION=+
MTTSPNTKIILHWFRHGDLRLHDNPALVHSCKKLSAASKQSDTYVIPFFCFDPKAFGNDAKSDFGNLKCGPRRAKFITEAVKDLQQNLVKKGSGLLVSHGQEPHEFVSKLVKDLSSESNPSQNPQWTIVCQEEVLKEETEAVRSMQSILPPSAKVQTVWGSTMYELEDLPFGEALGDLPNTFTPFRNKVEKKCEISPPLPTPSKELKAFFPSDGTLLKSMEQYMKPEAFPSLKQLGYNEASVKEASTVDPRGVMEFIGGETAALARVEDYIFTKDRLKIYFDTRNGMLGADYSTKFSPWLAFGCVSPRWIAKECRRYEQERGIQNKSTYWVVFELLWRDYCKFFCLKHGNRVFYPNGILSGTQQQPQTPWKVYQPVLDCWKEGKTGYPLVDANMREMRATGFMSNRGRQNVCSFLCLDLQQDWRHGGDFFETHLLDYDVYSNWYNWCAGAGMTGGRVNRFNIVKQSKDYDQHGDYVRHWLPELKDVPNQFIHEPWKMSQFQQREFGVSLGVDYPHRIQTAAPPSGGRGDDPSNQKRNRGRGRTNRQGNTGNKGESSRKTNSNNRHQKYEMKSLKEAQINIKSGGNGY